MSETTYKFFIQFCIYAMLYCTFTLVVSAYYTAQNHRKVPLLAMGIVMVTDKPQSDLYEVTWILVIAL